MSLLAQITTLVFDADGVLTNGTFANPKTPHSFLHKQDVAAIQDAVTDGFRIAVITGGSSESFKTYLHTLGIQDVFLRSYDKLDVWETYLLMYQLKADETLYMGDNFPDYPVMQRAGFPACPANAIDEIKTIARYISPYSGGNGAVADIIKKTQRAKKR